MIKIGLVGCGYWGPNLVRTLNEVPEAKVVAVSDLRPGRLDFIRARYPALHTTLVADELIHNPQIDALVIATPPKTHHVLAMAALNAGKHVLVEKPLTMDLGEGEEIVALAEAKGRVLMTGHLFLYAPAVVDIRQRLRQGDLGDLFLVSSTRANLGPPNTQVDVLWDLAPHDVSVILDLMGDFPSEIHTQGACFTDSGFAEAAFLTMRFPGGRMAHVEVNWLTPAKVRLMRVVCSEKTIHYDDASVTEKIRIFDAGVDSRVAAGSTSAQAIGYRPGAITIPSLPSSEPLRAECEDFVECIRDGREPVSSGRKGLDVVRVLTTATEQLNRQRGLQSASRAT